MKTTVFVAAAGLAAALFTVAAQAQTGRPSTQETAAAADAPQVVAADAQLGSYARYLMLNGKPRDVAVADARNIDHPAARVHAHTLASNAAAKVPTAQ